jgi:hypothetical protein
MTTTEVVSLSASKKGIKIVATDKIVERVANWSELTRAGCRSTKIHAQFFQNFYQTFIAQRGTLV